MHPAVDEGIDRFAADEIRVGRDVVAELVGIEPTEQLLFVLSKDGACASSACVSSATALESFVG